MYVYIAECAVFVRVTFNNHTIISWPTLLKYGQIKKKHSLSYQCVVNLD